MDISEVLNAIGLSDKESAVYAALLELGQAPVDQIAKKANIKRPTAYVVLGTLQNRGLASLVPKTKVNWYTAEPPEKILSDLYKKQELFKRTLPELQALYNAKVDKPIIQLHEGKDAVLSVYDKIYASGEVWFYATLGDLEQVLPQVTKDVSSNSKQHKLKVREILTGSQADKAYAAKVDIGEWYEVRFAPPGTQFFTDNAIFGNSVAFFSFKPQLSCVVITSKEIVGSLKSLYELAWNTSQLIPLAGEQK